MPVWASYSSQIVKGGPLVFVIICWPIEISQIAFKSKQKSDF